MTISDEAVSERSRRLALTVEPFTGQVYFSPEAHANYAALGFRASPGEFGGGVKLPDGPAYFCSRGSVMGQVPGEVVAAAFGVFNPDVVVPAVTYGWGLTDAPKICAARTAGGVAQLERLLGPEPDGLDRGVELLSRACEPLRPEGRPLFAGLRSQPPADAPLASAWQLADQLREFRGDAHVNAWTSAGLDPVEIGLLTERYWGLPSRSYIRSRGWVDEHLDTAEDRLRTRALFADGDITAAGREVREAVEVATDRQMRPAIDALGDDFDELIEIVGPWSTAIQEGSGYPMMGPHQLADLAKLATMADSRDPD
jgi:hypothetical protein